METKLTTNGETIMNKPSLFKFITSPALEMEKIKGKPTIWLPLIIVVLIGALSSVITAFIPNIIALQQEQMGMAGVEMGDGFAVFSAIMSGFGTLIAIPIMLLISAAIMLGVAKIFKGEGTFKHYFSVNIFILFIGNIGLLLNAIIAYLLDGLPQYTSLNGIVNATGNLGGALSAVEVFTIWTAVLTGIAFNKIGKLSKGVSIVLGILSFVIGLLIATFTGGFQ